jgi:3-oxoacyl-[acyl-carrier-protein] synthase I
MASFAITGAALANCLGTDNKTVLERAFAGTAAFSPAHAYFPFPFETVLGVFPQFSPAALDCAMTRVAMLAMASVQQLETQVAEAVSRFGAARVGYVFASSTGGLEETERTLAPHEALPIANPYLYGNHGIDATTPAIMKYLGISGPTMAVSTACSSGLKALASAMRWIEHGLADAVVVGSADSLTRTTIFGFHSLGLTSPTATQPFTQHRAGITLGEGSAYVVICRDSPNAIAHVLGTGGASDAFHHTSPHPEGLGGQLAMREALDRARISPNDISFVTAHGTGTPQNDATEAIAINRVFERQIPVTANKSVFGHTLGTAGLTNVALAVEALRLQEIPPTRHTAPIDAALGVNIVDKRTSARIEHVIVNAFGFGGSNASAVISRRG